jgi:hypothetical protein
MTTNNIVIGPVSGNVINTDIRYPRGQSSNYTDYDGPNDFSNMGLGSNVRTGSVFIANNLTTGDLYLGANAGGFDSYVFIGHANRYTKIQGRLNHQGDIATFGDNRDWIAGAGTPVVNIQSNSNRVDGMAFRAFNNINWIIQFFAVNSNTNRGVISGNGNAVTYNTTSDRRLKKNIQPMAPMLDKIMALKPREYDWKVDDDHGYGFVAQEVHEVFPQMRALHSCCYDEDGCCENVDEPIDCKTGEPIHYAVDYGLFTPYIIKAFQELKTDYDEKLAKMQAQIDFLLNALMQK